MKILVTTDSDIRRASAMAVSVIMQGHNVLVQTGMSGLLHAVSAPVKRLRDPGSTLPGLIRNYRPDVIVSFGSTDHSIAACTAPDVPLVKVRPDLRKTGSRWFWNMVDRRTDLFVFPGKSCIPHRFQEKAVVVSDSVDTEMFRPVSFCGEKIILSIGRLDPVKGHKTLLQAMTMVNTDTKVVVAGREATYTKKYLQNYAENLGVERNIIFTGETDVQPLLKKVAVGIVTSLGNQAVSRAGMEIMASGVPLLAAATGGLCDLVTDGVTGMLHSPGNWKQLAGQVSHLLENRGLAGMLAGNARRYAEEHLSPAAVGKRWTEVLEQLDIG